MRDKLLPKNVHPLERVFRVLVGLLLLALVFFGPQTLWGLLGVVPLLTGVLGSCPLYTACRLSTCSNRSRGQPQEG